MTNQLFQLASYAPNDLALAYVATGCLLLVLGLLVLGHETFSRTSLVFFAICLSTALTQFSSALSLFAVVREVAFYWITSIYVWVSFIPPAAYHFSVSLLGLNDRCEKGVWFAWASGFIFSGLVGYTGFFLEGTYEYWWGFYSRYNTSVIIFLGYFGLLEGMAFANFLGTYINASPGSRSHSVSRWMIIAFLISYLGCLDFLGGFGVPLPPLNWFSLFGFLGISGYVTWKHSLSPISASIVGQEIVSIMEEPVLVYNQEGLIRFSNRAFCSLLGYDPDEILDRPISDVLRVPDGWKNQLEGLLEADQANNESLEVLTSDNRVLNVQFSQSRFAEVSGIHDGSVILLHDVTREKELQDRLREKSSYLSNVLNAAPNIIAVKDSGLRYELANDTLVSFLGKPRDEILGRKLSEFLGNEQIHRREAKQLEVLGDETATEQFETEYRQPETGEQFWFHERCVPFRAGDQSAEQKLLVVATDISELKELQNDLEEALDEQESLHREMHHRVKNNLQVIISLLRLQVRNVSSPRVPKDVLKDLENRIYSMALIHERVYEQTSIQEIEAQTYLVDLAEHVIKSQAPPDLSVDLEARVDSLSLEVDTLLPCGIIANELITNSLKHGFEGRNQGGISLEFRSSGQGGNLTMVIQDDGSGLSNDNPLEESDSLGMDLVKNLSVGQLKGEIEQMDTEQGTGWKITIPTDGN